VKAEALATGTPFTFDGETYTIAPTTEWDLDALEAYEDGQIARCVRLILGADQWKAFRSKPRTVGELSDLFDAAQKAAGLGN
jgi:hypothetical protein